MTPESLKVAAHRLGLTMIVVSRRDAEKHDGWLRELFGCAPWESIETGQCNGARIVVADVHQSFALTYDMTMHIL